MLQALADKQQKLEKEKQIQQMENQKYLDFIKEKD